MVLQVVLVAPPVVQRAARLVLQPAVRLVLRRLCPFCRHWLSRPSPL